MDSETPCTKPPAPTDRVLPITVRAHGPFAFSRWYDDAAVTGKEMVALVWNTTVATLPILPEWASKLNQDLIVRSIFGTAAIEGSPLTEPEVSALLAAGGTTVTKSEKERAVLNLREAYHLAGVGGPRPANIGSMPLSEDRIQNLHRAIADDLDRDRYLPGLYRLGPVAVGDADHGGKYKPPKVPEDIAMLMARFVEWMNGEDLMAKTSPVIRAFLAHYHLALIHPFKDGNGRLARVVEAELLERAGFRYVSLMMSNFYYEHIDDYYKALSAAEKNDFNLTPFLEFCLDGLVRSLTEIHAKVADQVRRLALRKHYDDLRYDRKLSWRRHQLMLMLLEDDKPFRVPDLRISARFAALYKDVSPLSASRDARRLRDLGLLTVGEMGVHTLNLRVLG